MTSGTANLSVSTLTQGKHQITASYSGDINFNPNSAKPLTRMVKP